MNKAFAYGVVFLGLGIAQAWAQSGEAPQPTEPLLRRAPGKSEWTVSYEYGRKSKDAAAPVAAGNDTFLKALTVTKDDKVYREVSQWGDGRVAEKWISGDLQVYETPYTKRIARAILPSTSQYADSYSDYRRSDFEELEWIGKDNFQGVVEQDGRKVFVFRLEKGKTRFTPRELSGLTDGEDQSEADLKKRLEEYAASSAGYTAYLDVATQLPVMFSDGTITRTYRYTEVPPPALVIPVRFATELAKWQKDLVRRAPLPTP